MARKARRKLAAMLRKTKAESATPESRMADDDMNDMRPSLFGSEVVASWHERMLRTYATVQSCARTTMSLCTRVASVGERKPRCAVSLLPVRRAAAADGPGRVRTARSMAESAGFELWPCPGPLHSGRRGREKTLAWRAARVL